MMRWLLLSILLMTSGLGLQGCGPNAKPEESCNFVQNSEAQRVSWSNAVPIVLHIDKSVPAEFHDAIREAARVWNDISNRQLIRIGDVREFGEPAATSDQTSVIYFKNTWESSRGYEQARTTVYWRGDQIYESDVRVNAHNFKYSLTAAPGMVDLESLLIHEFGHVLGLAHNEIDGSVMAKSLSTNQERRTVSENDQKSLRCEY